MSDDLLDQLSDEWAAADKSARRPKKGLKTPPVDRRAVREASVSTARRAGPFNRKTIYVAPSLEMEIEQAADAEGVGLMAFYRFLLEEGFENYRSGRAAPQLVTPLSHRLKTDPT